MGLQVRVSRRRSITIKWNDPSLNIDWAIDNQSYNKRQIEEKMGKALILTFSKYQDHEVIYYYRLLEEGIETDIMADISGEFMEFGNLHGGQRTVDELDTKFDEIMDEYDLLVIPGGVKSLEKLRQEKQALRFINEWDKKAKNWLHLPRSADANIF